MIRLAFYKGEGDIFDKLIRLWTRSPYSHVEMVFGDLWYSSSPRDGGVRLKLIDPSPEHWDFVDLDVIPKKREEMRKFLISQLGKKYDWTGILLSQILPLDAQDPNRWFCSEICTAALKAGGVGLKNHPQWYSPARLYREVSRLTFQGDSRENSAKKAAHGAG